MKKSLLTLALGLALLLMGAAPGHAQRTITVSGGCIDSPVTLTENGINYGKPYFEGNGSVNGNAGIPITITWLSYGSVNSWFLRFSGSPYYEYAVDTPLPPDNSTGVWMRIPPSPAQESFCPSGGATLVVSGTGTQSTSVSVMGINRTGAQLTNAASVNFTVSFSSSVSGLTTSNFSVPTTGSVSGASVTNVTGSGSSYTVSVNTGTGDGTMGLRLANATGLTPSVSNVPFVGQSYTIDKTRPTLSITSTASNPTPTSPIPVTFTFSESMTGFVANDVTVGNGTLGNFSGSGSSYSASVTPTAGGIVTVNVAANVAQDAATNGNEAATQFSIQYSPIVVSTVTTDAASSISPTSATLGGNVTADGGGTVTERGVVYVVGNGTPTISDTKVVIGSGTGTFSQNVTGLGANTSYSVRAYATNSAGTSYGNKQTFITPAALAILVSSQVSLTCNADNSGSITVVASGGVGSYNYTLNPGNIQNSTGTFNGLAAGNYMVTVTDQASGSATTNTVTLTQPAAVPAPTLSANPGNTTTNQSITVSASGCSGTIGWNANGGTDNGNGTYTFTNAGSHSISANCTIDGCASPASASIQLTINACALALNQPAVTNLTCFQSGDGVIAITTTGGNGPLTYTLNPGGVQNSTGSFANLSAGSYAISVTDANNCSASSASIGVTQPAAVPAPTLAASPGTTTTNQPITISATGCENGTVAWNAGGGTGVASGNQYTFSQPGGYTLSATCTIDGCTSPASPTSSLTINPCPSISLTTSGDKSVVLGIGSNCTELSAIADGGTGLYTYAWTSDATPPARLAGPTVNVCPEASTTYTVTATDANGCQSAAVQLKVTVDDVRCGNKNQNVTICYYGLTLCVTQKVAERYLKLGATIGACGSGNARISYEQDATAPLQLALKAFPNPVQDAVTLEVLAPRASAVTIQVLDLTGVVRQTHRENLVEGSNEIEFRLGTLNTGIYLIQVVDALGRQGVVKVSKE